jgi:cobaltochelatase CobN
VDAAKWQQIFEVYVEDRYGRDIKKFFNAHNSWAYQSMTARMLEAIRKDYWQADERITRKLAVEYALNVVEKGVACCHHTCNNPLLNQMVVNIISLPGVLSPEMVEKFKLAIEKMAQKSLEMQIVDRKELVVKLNDRLDKMNRNAPQEERKTSADQELSEESPKTSSEAVEGYKMEDMDVRDDTTVLSSSGIQWAASLFVLLVMGLFFWGMRRRR